MTTQASCALRIRDGVTVTNVHPVPEKDRHVFGNFADVRAVVAGVLDYLDSLNGDETILGVLIVPQIPDLHAEVIHTQSRHPLDAPPTPERGDGE